MKLLLDTHLLIWAADQPQRLSPEARSLLSEPANELLFSPASLWEIAIKSALGRADFHVEAGILRTGLLNNGYSELVITGAHAVATAVLPLIHKDPFDRILLAQATVEGLTLVTTDPVLLKYPAPVQAV